LNNTVYLFFVLIIIKYFIFPNLWLQFKIYPTFILLNKYLGKRYAHISYGQWSYKSLTICDIFFMTGFASYPVKLLVSVSHAWLSKTDKSATNLGEILSNFSSSSLTFLKYSYSDGNDGCLAPLLKYCHEFKLWAWAYSHWNKTWESRKILNQLKRPAEE